jgi:hypothetical protein
MPNRDGYFGVKLPGDTETTKQGILYHQSKRMKAKGTFRRTQEATTIKEVVHKFS